MKKIIFLGILISVFFAFFISPFASTSPDGLEKVAKDKGFVKLAEGKGVLKCLMPDYTVPGIKNEKLSTSVAGFAGTILTFGFAFALGYILKRKR